MTAQEAVRRIIDRLRNHPTIARELGPLISSPPAAATGSLWFGHLSRALRELGHPKGWNRFWTKKGLCLYFGRICWEIPARAVGVELLESPDGGGVRDWLAGCFTSTAEPVHPMPPEPKAAWWLGLTNADDGRRLMFLNQINLMRRELPTIEHWRWSRSGGMASLSDGGRFTVPVGYGWLRAIESGLDPSERIPVGVSRMANLLLHSAGAPLPKRASAAVRGFIAKAKWFELIDISDGQAQDLEGLGIAVELGNILYGNTIGK